MHLSIQSDCVYESLTGVHRRAAVFKHLLPSLLTVVLRVIDCFEETLAALLSYLPQKKP